MGRLDFGIERATSKKKVEDQKMAQIQLNPLDINKTFGVVFRFEDKEHKTQIHYKISVLYLDQIENNYVIELQKQQVYINEEKPYSTLDELADKCGKVLYPLHILVDKNFNLIGLRNFKKLQERWQLKKIEISRCFKGKEVDRVLKGMSLVLSSEKSLLKKIKKDWFFLVFFNVNRKSDETKYPVIPYKVGVLFSEKKKTVYHKIRSKDIVIHKKGECIDTRSERDILDGNIISIEEYKNSGTYTLDYHFYNQSRSVDAIIGNFNVTLSSGYEKKIALEIYNLKNEKSISSKEQKEQDQKEIDEEIKSKQKKKRYFLFGKELKILKKKK